MDIKCVRCGEPWDSYGVTHGDMLPWEAKLFRLGAGCPSCEGRGNWEPQTISDVENGDEDPMARIVAHERGAAVPWRRPDDVVHWTCDGCGVQVVTDVDTNELAYRVPSGAKCRGWYHSHPFGYSGEPTAKPAHMFGSSPVCEFCLDSCADCGAPITSHLEFGDIYDEGYSIPQPGSYRDCVCVNCYERYCTMCESRCEDCECCDEGDAEKEDGDNG